jgi:hypothetical protein
VSVANSFPSLLSVTNKYNDENAKHGFAKYHTL